MSNYPDAGDMDKSQRGDTQHYRLSQANTVVTIGGDHPPDEIVVLPEGTQVMQLNMSCNGPDCQQNEAFASGHWLHLSRFPSTFYRFCSFHCLHSWVEAQAKEGTEHAH